MDYTVTMMLGQDEGEVTHRVEADDPQDAAQEAFWRSNQDASGDPQREYRSLSVGDIVKVFDGEDTHYFMCCSEGWQQIEAEFVKPWLELDFIHRVGHPLTRMTDPVAAMLTRIRMRRNIIPFV